MLLRRLECILWTRGEDCEGSLLETRRANARPSVPRRTEHGFKMISASLIPRVIKRQTRHHASAKEHAEHERRHGDQLVGVGEVICL